MAAAATSTGPSTTPETPVPRTVRLVRVGALLASGMAIAFTAPLHEQLGFDRGVSAIALGALGIAHLIEWRARRGVPAYPVPLLLGLAAVLAALALPFAGTPILFACVIAAWGLVSGLLELVGNALMRTDGRSDRVLLGASGILLALLCLLVREDPVAVLGFFGAYAIVAGVFLGISAFDVRRPEPARDDH
ncbi:DUF308 domain-containing protein [Leucobacter massiliensis]|uniref:DUF308 domain-containing protein n=1 Tax=Leucobacter massiliensis TaxID=1686285 RepID=A0A2S9QRW7_9MICO|nr:DUF308 domain-containing protein [Leucobacter massiliensis]PRI12312.1 hypothetical protein B4915_01105 [Leucobacter massiliensis]